MDRTRILTRLFELNLKRKTHETTQKKMVQPGTIIHIKMGTRMAKDQK